MMFIDTAHKLPQHNPGDAFLWEQVKRGEKAGMEGLYMKYGQQLFKLGMSIKNDRNLIKDCIQEVFVTVWKYRQSLQDTDNVKLYLFKCLSNKIYKEIGKDKRRYSQEGIDHYEALIVEDPIEPDDNSINGRKREHLLVALENLPMRQKEVIQLLFFENESYEDTSKIMGINVQSVYTLAWKAISKLKKKMHVLSPMLLWLMDVV